MSRLFLVAALCSAALWGIAALNALPFSQWVLPFADSDALLPEQIFFAFGLIPRAVIALIIGALLGLSGALMQAVLRNPLADPTTLGVASGAQLSLVFATLIWPEALALGRGPVALFGGGLSALIVMALAARRGFAPVTVTIAGMLVGMLASAISTALTLGQGHYLLSLVIWNGGALSQDSWHGVFRLIGVLILGGAGAAILVRPLVVLSLGGATAQALGARVGLIRVASLALAVILSAMVSAEVGLVGFVGLAAPALVRRLGARSVTQVLLASPLAGAGLLSVVDSGLMALVAFGGPTLPTGALTGLIGGPVLIALLPKLRNIVPPETERNNTLPPRAKHPWRRVALLACATLVLTVLSLFGGRGPDGWGMISGDIAATFLPLRATAILAAASAGALLALSGAVLQRVTANPMAAPEVLGVTGGAALGYAATLFLFPAPSSFALALGSSTGAAVTLIVLSAYATRADMAPARLLLAGLAVGAFASALLAAIMASGDPRAWSLLGWLAGSAARATVSGALALSVMAVIGLGGALLVSRWFDILPLGADVARGVGLPVGRVRLGLVLGAGLATGAASVLVGPVSFIGLMAPHIARSLGLLRPAPFLAASWCLGALLMCLAAFGARTASYPYDLPLGLFATLIGAPWLFIALLGRRHA
ncbi:Fe(3+)-hydroxamate ABC transporter permease FhuB [uncultured Sulfitobacter sp.]|uniref:Fe(3+)-hydroxamate ABC transporter permease FhuB n=1 Tax=uncultured Sulfitobacter sp. TaxID=191468 RepID=UPI0030D850B9|tara:strand:- start:24120 stop:26087 length:1968 start_codon:yes stop_codon:yes gene_type:complete